MSAEVYWLALNNLNMTCMMNECGRCWSQPGTMALYWRYLVDRWRLLRIYFFNLCGRYCVWTTSSNPDTLWSLYLAKKSYFNTLFCRSSPLFVFTTTLEPSFLYSWHHLLMWGNHNFSSHGFTWSCFDTWKALSVFTALLSSSLDDEMATPRSKVRNGWRSLKATSCSPFFTNRSHACSLWKSHI